MPEQTTYLVTAADTLLSYTTIVQLCNRPNTFIFALTNTSSEEWLWRLLCIGRASKNSFVQPMHISSTFSISIKQAAEMVAEKWQKRVDVVIACPDSNIDPRVLMSVFMPVVKCEGKILVLRRKMEGWCKDFVGQIHKGSGIVSVGIEVGDSAETEMRERMAWMLNFMDRVSKKKGYGSVVAWD